MTCTTYTKLHIYGSKDATGITLTDSSVVTAVATALRTSATYTGISNGYTIKVGLCVSGAYEITSSGSVCTCNAGYTLRPCRGNQDWGGIDAATTCSPPTQTMSVVFS